MKVWLLYRCAESYDNEYLKGVYSSLEKAMAANRESGIEVPDKWTRDPEDGTWRNGLHGPDGSDASRIEEFEVE